MKGIELVVIIIDWDTRRDNILSKQRSSRDRRRRRRRRRRRILFLFSVRI